MNNTENCETCRYWKTYPGFDGICKRHSPRVSLVITMDEYKNFYGKWPLVGRDNWCGDYESSSAPLQAPESPVEA